MKRVRKRANLASVIEPQLVTLTKSPANRIGWKVIRSAEGAEQRNDNYLLCIELPPQITREQAMIAAEEYGLSEQYDLLERGDRYYLCRDDVDAPEDTKDYVPVHLIGGAIARVSPKAFQRSEEFVEAQRSDESDKGLGKSIRLVSLRFDREVFKTPAEIDSWLKENDIDYPVNGVEQLDSAFEVVRSEADQDTREVTFAEGVTGTICRSETLDYPYALYGKTVEQAYGQWGWSQLDFTAMQADRSFSEGAVEAIDILRSVLENIVVDSELPLETRKQLIVNAAGGYAAYTIGLIDALPKSVVEQTRSDEQTDGQETDMSNEAKTAAESESVDTQVERNEAEAEQKTEVVEESTQEATPEYVTRSELKEAVAEAIAEAMQPKQEAEVEAVEESTEETQRSDTDEKLDKVLEAIGNLAGKVEDQQEKIQTLRNDFEEAEQGTTVSRSVESEGTPAEDSQPASVFSGIFSRAN